MKRLSLDLLQSGAMALIFCFVAAMAGAGFFMMFGSPYRARWIMPFYMTLTYGFFALWALLLAAIRVLRKRGVEVKSFRVTRVL